MNHFNSQNLNTSAVNAINISSVINDYESVKWFLYDFSKISDLIFQKSDESREIFMLLDYIWWLRTYKIDVKSICPNGRSMYTIIGKRGSTWIRVNTEQYLDTADSSRIYIIILSLETPKVIIVQCNVILELICTKKWINIRKLKSIEI